MSGPLQSKQAECWIVQLERTHVRMKTDGIIILSQALCGFFGQGLIKVSEIIKWIDNRE